MASKISRWNRLFMLGRYFDNISWRQRIHSLPVINAPKDKNLCFPSYNRKQGATAGQILWDVAYCLLPWHDTRAQQITAVQCRQLKMRVEMTGFDFVLPAFDACEWYRCGTIKQGILWGVHLDAEARIAYVLITEGNDFIANSRGRVTP